MSNDEYMDYQEHGGLQQHDKHICEICGANPRTDSSVVLLRANAKGQDPRWRCQKHPLITRSPVAGADMSGAGMCDECPEESCARTGICASTGLPRPALGADEGAWRYDESGIHKDSDTPPRGTKMWGCLHDPQGMRVTAIGTDLGHQIAAGLNALRPTPSQPTGEREEAAKWCEILAASNDEQANHPECNCREEHRVAAAKLRLAALSLRQRGGVTDEMVERALDAFDSGWRQDSRGTRQGMTRDMRAALQAAWRTK